MNVISHQSFGSVRSLVIKGEPWFVAKDVCDVLNLVFGRSSVRLLDDDEKGVHTMNTPGGKQDVTIVNESGLYSLIFQSRKPEAKQFRKWVTSEVLPSIRKHGYYVNPQSELSKGEQRKLEKLMLESLAKYIYPEDIYKCHQKLRVSESQIHSVMKGNITDNVVMNDLQARAIANRERYVNAYSTRRMYEIVEYLTKMQ